MTYCTLERIEPRLFLHAGHDHAEPATSDPAAQTIVNDVQANLEPTDTARVTSGWTPIAPLPLARTESQRIEKDGLFYIFGGFFDDRWDATKRVDVYNPSADEWTRLPDMPVAITHAATVVDGDNAILIGGYVGDSPGPSTRDVWTFNTRTKSWSKLPPLPDSRGGGGAGIVGTKLYFFGGAKRGTTGVEVDYANTWSLDLSKTYLGWQKRAAMPTPRNHLGFATLGGKLYAIGGQLRNRESTGNQSVVHSYNPANDRWSNVASLPMTLGHIHAGTDAADGKIVVVGGVTNGFVNTSKIHVFDPTQNRWSVGGSLPAPRKSVNLMIDNGTLFIAGGGNNVATTSGYKMPWGDAARTTPGSYEPTDDRQLFSSRAIELVQI